MGAVWLGDYNPPQCDWVEKQVVQSGDPTQIFYAIVPAVGIDVIDNVFV
jgi:hypothetical protein